MKSAPRCVDDDGDTERHQHPEVGEDVVSLLELVDGGAADLTVEKRVEVLSHQDAEGGNHAYSAVLELGLADLLHLAISLIGGNTQRIKESDRREGTCG